MMLAKDQRTAHSPAGAIALWLAMQLLALGLGAAGARLWARAPDSGEHALHIMLATQLLTATLLFPFLLATWQRASLVMLLALPFVQFSGIIALMPRSASWLAGLHLAMWLAALSLLTLTLRSDRQRLWAMAVVASVTLGSTFLHYCRSEKASSAGDGFASVSAVLAGLSTLSHHEFGWISAAPAAAVLAVALLLLVVRGRSARSRHVIHTPSTTA